MSSSASEHTTTTGKSPSFQFYVSDFVTGTITLSTEEIGAYILLLCHAWDNGLVPLENVQRARIARLSPARMKRVWMSLESKFQQTETGYIQPRIERERQKQADYRRRQSDASRIRWDKPKPSDGNPDASLRDIPKASSSVFSLQSSSSDCSHKSGAHAKNSGVMAGETPWDHRYCRQPCERVCLSERQHAILRARHGGTDADLDAFYAEVRSRLDPNVPIGEKPWQFWDTQFAAKFGTVAVTNPRTAGNIAAAARFVARGKA